MKRPSDNERIWFLKDILQNQVGYKEALDGKANVILGVSGVVFGLVLTQLGAAPNLMFRLAAVALMAATGISALLCIWTIKMPFMKQKAKQRLMCYTGFSGMSQEEYSRSIGKVLDSRERLEDEYLTEIYGLAKNSIEPKYRMVGLSTTILTAGLFVSLLLFALGMAMN